MVPRTVLTRAIHTRFEEKRSDYSISLGNSKGGKLLESVSQMCDKKNSVLFTDTECVNVIPQGSLTCLFAKATPDESNLWHRRLGHVNFKTMNKLAEALITETKSRIHVRSTSNTLVTTQKWVAKLSTLPSVFVLCDAEIMGIVRFGNDHFTAITGYGDYVQGNLTICHVYYVEGLGHNLFSVRQFCDGDLEVAFRSNTCYVRNLKGDDLLTGSRDSNLYTISISEMAASSPVCLMSRATSTKS
ncbi:integrase, catalytic region, zinc finger, CCHC-type containing protein [Tanacetum coccineum]|uniref:Integrase, catalytic region, zinc finger, CCHC-type containing protein n=1 Tax=Tanacetum coccineum TaxID=301880 RepID=A0ABQ5I8Z3_9ASTR